MIGAAEGHGALPCLPAQLQGRRRPRRQPDNLWQGPRSASADHYAIKACRFAWVIVAGKRLGAREDAKSEPEEPAILCIAIAPQLAKPFG